MPFSLNCPSCGAAAPSADPGRCEYCGSALTTASCPSCFGVMFAGMQFCPHCGVKASRVVDASAAPLACPGCRGDMRSVQVGSTPMYECGSCGSVWLDAGTFMQLCQDREERGAVASIIAGPAAVGVVPTAGGRVRYVHCPICKKVLNRENFGRQSGVVIDVCKNDGVWFERGELRSVLAFIDGGGLERARVREYTRMAEEQRSLARELKESARMAQQSVSISFVRQSGSVDSLLSEALRGLFS